MQKVGMQRRILAKFARYTRQASRLPRDKKKFWTNKEETKMKENIAYIFGRCYGLQNMLAGPKYDPTAKKNRMRYSDPCPVLRKSTAI